MGNSRNKNKNNSDRYRNDQGRKGGSNSNNNSGNDSNRGKSGGRKGGRGGGGGGLGSLGNYKVTSPEFTKPRPVKVEDDFSSDDDVWRGKGRRGSDLFMDSDSDVDMNTFRWREPSRSRSGSKDKIIWKAGESKKKSYHEKHEEIERIAKERKERKRKEEDQAERDRKSRQCEEMQRKKEKNDRQHVRFCNHGTFNNSTNRHVPWTQQLSFAWPTKTRNWPTNLNWSSTQHWPPAQDWAPTVNWCDMVYDPYQERYLNAWEIRQALSLDDVYMIDVDDAVTRPGDFEFDPDYSYVGRTEPTDAEMMEAPPLWEPGQWSWNGLYGTSLTSTGYQNTFQPFSQPVIADNAPFFVTQSPPQAPIEGLPVIKIQPPTPLKPGAAPFSGSAPCFFPAAAVDSHQGTSMTGQPSENIWGSNVWQTEPVVPDWLEPFLLGPVDDPLQCVFPNVTEAMIYFEKYVYANYELQDCIARAATLVAYMGSERACELYRLKLEQITECKARVVHVLTQGNFLPYVGTQSVGFPSLVQLGQDQLDPNPINAGNPIPGTSWQVGTGGQPSGQGVIFPNADNNGQDTGSWSTMKDFSVKHPAKHEADKESSRAKRGSSRDDDDEPKGVRKGSRYGGSRRS